MTTALTLLLLSTLLPAAAAAPVLPVPAPRLFVPVPEFKVAPPEVRFAAWPFAASDWPAESCRRLPGTLFLEEENLLDLKARYWAYRFTVGGRADGLISNPGSEIFDRGQRRTFYEKLDAFMRLPHPAPLTASELARLRARMSRMLERIRACGGENGELRRGLAQLVPIR